MSDVAGYGKKMNDSWRGRYSITELKYPQDLILKVSAEYFDFADFNSLDEQ